MLPIYLVLSFPLFIGLWTLWEQGVDEGKKLTSLFGAQGSLMEGLQVNQILCKDHHNHMPEFQLVGKMEEQREWVNLVELLSSAAGFPCAWRTYLSLNCPKHFTDLLSTNLTTLSIFEASLRFCMGMEVIKALFSSVPFGIDLEKGRSW